MNAVLELIGAAANLVMAGAAVWGVRAWRKQSEWNRERDANHATAIVVLRAVHKARGYVVVAAHLGPLLRPILEGNDPEKRRRLENEVNRMVPAFENAQAMVLEASFEARTLWGEHERALLTDLRQLNRIVEGTRNALAVLALDAAGILRGSDYVPFPMPWDWHRMIEGDDAEWQKMRTALQTVVERIEASTSRHIATRTAAPPPGSSRPLLEADGPSQASAPPKEET